ncbi:MAG: hypothetical protein DRJ35_06445, partial [Thermoprotei archaeon]
MRKTIILSILLLITLFLATLPITAYPQGEEAFVTWMIGTRKNLKDVRIYSEGISFETGWSRGYEAIMYIALFLEEPYDKVIDHIDTNGLLSQVYFTGRYTVVTINSYPGQKNVYIRPIGSAYFKAKEIQVESRYDIKTKTTMQGSGSERHIAFSYNYDSFLSEFGPNISYIYVSVSWRGECSLKGLYSPSGRDLTTNPASPFMFGSNYVFVSLRSPIPGDRAEEGTWSVLLENCRWLQGTEKASVNLKARVKTDHIIIRLNPGEIREFRASELLDATPNGWILDKPVYVVVERLSSTGSLDLRDVSYAFRYRNMVSGYLLSDSFRVINNGSSRVSAKVYLKATYVKEIDPSLSLDISGDKAVLDVSFQAPYWSNVPFENVEFISLWLGLPFKIKPIGLYTPDGKLADKIVVREREGTYKIYKSVVYTYSGCLISFSPNSYPFPGVWVYKALVPDIEISDNLNITNLPGAKQPDWLSGKPGSRRGLYSLGDNVTITPPKEPVQAGKSVRFVFNGFRCIQGCNWNSPKRVINLVFDEAKVVKIEALWTRQFYVEVASGKEVVEGGGWYNESSIARLSVKSRILEVAKGMRYVFAG